MNAVEAFDELMRMTDLEDEFKHAYESNLRVTRHYLEENNPEMFFVCVMTQQNISGEK